MHQTVRLESRAGRALSTFAALLPIGAAFAAMEPPAVEWDRTFLNGVDGRAIRETTNGDLVVGGTMYYSDGSTWWSDFYIMKTDSGGSPLWERTFSSPGATEDSFDFVRSICIGTDGNYVLGGMTYNDFALLKISEAGELIWMKTYHPTQEFRVGVGAVAEALDGHYKLAGFDIWGNAYVLQIDEDGGVVWERRFRTSFLPNTDAMVTSVVSTADGGCAVAGACILNGWKGYLARLDDAGDVIWERTFVTTGVEPIVHCLRLTSDGGFVVGGEGMWGKVDAQGQTAWLRDSSPTLDSVSSIQQTTDGGYIATGWGRVVKLGDEGELIWQKGFQGDYGGAVLQTVDGGHVVVVGMRNGSTATGLRILKFAAESPPARFRRGRTNGDDALNVADAICLLGYLFGPAADPCKQTVAQCLDAADTNDDGRVNISDAIMLLRHVFGGPALAAPFEACGADETADGVGCVSFVACN